MLITETHSLYPVLVHGHTLSAIFALSSTHSSFLICPFSLLLFGGILIFQSLYLGISAASLFFFLPHPGCSPTHFEILLIVLFLPVPVLKSCHFLSAATAKNLFLIPSSITTCSLVLRICPVANPHELAKFLFSTQKDYMLCSGFLLSQFKLKSF